ncbi:22154_t:CDS:2 [Gigaspora margarita]|uniref:22154_t:CDS:1 n=1 Tax=Gigaspora margarita TaxID=4874 RepID=A0ABM8W1G4_GIGMA|nr:22154_t:CDS:2 [Gigaspora margarita]
MSNYFMEELQWVCKNRTSHLPEKQTGIGTTQLEGSLYLEL